MVPRFPVGTLEVCKPEPPKEEDGGGGIAGDFPICAVPMIHQDLRRPCPYWGFFCQISDSTTS